MKNFFLHEGFDLFFFFLILVLVGYFMAPTLFPQLKRPFNCSRFDNNFAGCVNAQQQGRGCAWYSDCRTCIIASEGMNGCKK